MLSSSIAFAGNETQTGFLLDDLAISYDMDGTSVVESTSFTDVDGSAVNMLRVVQPNGIITTQIVVNGVVQQVPTMVRADYDVFYALANSISLPTPYLLAPSPRSGGCAAGSQYRHLFCATNMQTFTKDQADTTAKFVTVIFTFIAPPSAVAISIAGAVVSLFNSSDASH